MKRQRNEENYRDVKSRDGGFSPHISKHTAERIIRFCRTKNIGKTKFVEECINKQLDILEPEYYESLTKEELLKLILK